MRGSNCHHLCFPPRFERQSFRLWQQLTDNKLCVTSAYKHTSVFFLKKKKKSSDTVHLLELTRLSQKVSEIKKKRSS